MIEPEIVIGPPGTGKTTELLRIVDEELERGTSPRRVGFFSFTRRAAREAAERAARKFGLPPGELRYFQTLHSLCFRALGLSGAAVLERGRYEEFGDWAGVRVTGYQGSAEEGVFAGSEVGDRILFMENLSRVRCVPLREQYEEYSDGLEWREVDRVSRELAAFKRAHDLLDYTDMLSRVVEGEEWLPELDVLIVDEAQDLSELQWRVVWRMAERARRFAVAGDDDQALYRWAGAAVDRFVGMDGEARVLGQSHRVPAAVQAIAHEVIGRVRHRRPKEWIARDAAGSLERVGRLDDADLAGSSVLILARNTFILRNVVEPLLRSDGIVYEHRGHPSVRVVVLEAVLAWEALRRGERVPVAGALRAYDLMSSGEAVARGHKKLPKFDADGDCSMQELRERGGLRADGIWHEAMDRLAPEERTYMLRALRKGEKLRDEPRVRISTIHGAKGGEADRVILLTDVAQRTFDESHENPEDEARVWYVAATRARESLTIVAPRTKRNYAL